MTPCQFREGGRDVVIAHVTVTIPVGRMMISATDQGVCFVQFGDTQGALLKDPKKEYPAARLEEMARPYPGEFDCCVSRLTEYIAGRQPHLDLPLDIRADGFPDEGLELPAPVRFSAVVRRGSSDREPKAARGVALRVRATGSQL